MIEIQKTDCNCNDCIFMQRNIARFNTWYAIYYHKQYNSWRNKKCRRILSARRKMQKDYEKGLIALNEAVAMVFNYFPQNAAINYGTCTKLKKDVSFIPNTLQLNTQDCFQHRKSN